MSSNNSNSWVSANLTSQVIDSQPQCKAKDPPWLTSHRQLTHSTFSHESNQMGPKLPAKQLGRPLWHRGWLKQPTYRREEVVWWPGATTTTHSMREALTLTTFYLKRPDDQSAQNFIHLLNPLLYSKLSDVTERLTLSLPKNLIWKISQCQGSSRSRQDSRTTL